MSEQILSTKKLSAVQKQVFLDADISIFDYDAISVNLTDFNSPKKIKNAIFSSQNAVKSVKIHQKQLFSGVIENCFCVGDKTASLLEENGQNVVKIAEKASDLGRFIENSFKNEDFYFFCGSNRRDELPEIFKKSKNRLFELKTYDIELKSKHFEQKWNKIMFFSPSGVQSFIAENTIGDALAICIGPTTASEAKRHSANVIIADDTTVDSVIEKTKRIKYNLSPRAQSRGL